MLSCNFILSFVFMIMTDSYVNPCASCMVKTRDPVPSPNPWLVRVSFSSCVCVRNRVLVWDFGIAASVNLFSCRDWIRVVAAYMPEYTSLRAYATSMGFLYEHNSSWVMFATSVGRLYLSSNRFSLSMYGSWLMSPIRAISLARDRRAAITIAPKWFIRASSIIRRWHPTCSLKPFTRTDAIVRTLVLTMSPILCASLFRISTAASVVVVIMVSLLTSKLFTTQVVFPHPGTPFTQAMVGIVQLFQVALMVSAFARILSSSIILVH
ncbi:hypothetical protein JYU34_019612 [Plutella xylostella]|uniref:Uncharacterized protein n=1 Tax=Plutella xylostella TaxID=51655 RepID=A0ABQ7PS69_PLUXY|nr:hypothetical protein JYU34_020889 [Plutella xylostella]KAG7295940.1 hypothetical protein JYU34_021028 [Plutella xylostella]KAG7297569.1 hypothetical protein JYU34_019612 [Plutella xylostella]